MLPHWERAMKSYAKRLLKLFGVVASHASIAFALTACSQHPVTAPVRWAVGPEGSSILDINGENANELHRCWKKGTRFDCIYAQQNQMSGGARFTSIQRYDATSLEQARNTLDLNLTGYLCWFTSDDPGLVEEISSQNGNRLISRSSKGMNILSPPPIWTRDFVEAFFRDNKLTPNARYFNCQAANRVVVEGSIASLGTTALSLSSLDEGV